MVCLKVLPDVPVANLVHPSCFPKNFRKHWFTNVWALCSVVLLIRHVSAPYSNTDLTFVLNRQFFVVLPIILDFHTFLKMWNAALLILVFTSASSPLSHNSNMHCNPQQHAVGEWQHGQLRLPGNPKLTRTTTQSPTHIYATKKQCNKSYNNQDKSRAVANGPVGPAMAGPIIEPAIFFS